MAVIIDTSNIVYRLIKMYQDACCVTFEVLTDSSYVFVKRFFVKFSIQSLG
jgi:hypothetical protein